MSLTFQTFANSILDAQGNKNVAARTRLRLFNLVIGRWRFSGSEINVDDVATAYRHKLTADMRQFVTTTIGTISNVIASDATFLKDLWSMSEIAHEIEEQRNVDQDRYRRLYPIVDGPEELPGFTLAGADA